MATARRRGGLLGLLLLLAVGCQLSYGAPEVDGDALATMDLGEGQDDTVLLGEEEDTDQGTQSGPQVVKSLTGMFSHEFDQLAQKQLGTKMGGAITDPVKEKEVGQKALLREVGQKKEAKKEEELAEANAAKDAEAESTEARAYAQRSTWKESRYKAGLKGYLDLRSVTIREASLMAARAKFTPLIVCPAGSCAKDDQGHGSRSCVLGSALLELKCPENSRKQIAQNVQSFKCINCNVGGTCGITSGRCANGDFGWTCGGCRWSYKGEVRCRECPRYTMPPADKDVTYTEASKTGGIITESDARLNMFGRPKTSAPCQKKCGECSTLTGRKMRTCVNVKRYNQHVKDAMATVGDSRYIAVLRSELGKSTKVYSINKLSTSFPGLENPPNAKSKVLSVRCCKGVGTKAKCTSKTGEKGKKSVCYPKALTFDEAWAVCKQDGKRLCTAEEAMLCHGTGCNYNHHYSWVSAAPATVNATVAAPIVTDVNVTAGVKMPTQFLDDPIKDDDQCKFVSKPVLRARKVAKLKEARSTGKDVLGKEVNGAMSRACEFFAQKPYLATPKIDCTCGMLETRGCQKSGGYEFTACAVPKKMDPVKCPPTAARSTGAGFNVCTECNLKGVCKFKTRLDNCGLKGCTGCKWIKMSTTAADEATCEQCPTLVSTDVSAQYATSELINKDGRPHSPAMPCKKDCQECYMPANAIPKDGGTTWKQEARCVNVWRYNHNNPTRFMSTDITADDQECSLHMPRGPMSWSTAITGECGGAEQKVGKVTLGQCKAACEASATCQYIDIAKKSDIDGKRLCYLVPHACATVADRGNYVHYKLTKSAGSGAILGRRRTGVAPAPSSSSASSAPGGPTSAAATKCPSATQTPDGRGKISWYCDPSQTEKSWELKKSFCESQNKRLCSYAEVCPKGEQKLKGGVSPFGLSYDLWIATGDASNKWVQAGVHPGGWPFCGIHPPAGGLNGGPPWGTGTGAHSYRRDSACCEGATSAAGAKVEKSVLLPGESLKAGKRLVVGNNRLEMQGDGNLVIYCGLTGMKSSWASNTSSKGNWAGKGNWLSFDKADGSLVVYADSGRGPLLKKKTLTGSLSDAAKVTLNSDGKLVTLDSKGRALKRTGKGC